ncbi:hypothetical protein LEMLEM_LOCUS3374 [Lemmus lemmus]
MMFWGSNPMPPRKN